MAALIRESSLDSGSESSSEASSREEDSPCGCGEECIAN